MRKMKKLVSYLLLLAIPVAIAAGLFIFNGSGYRLSEQDAADIAYKNAGVKTSEISQSTVSKSRSGLHGSYEISFTTSDNHFEYTIDGQSGSILKHKSDHPTSKDEDDTQKSEEPKDETQPSESKEETAVSKEIAITFAEGLVIAENDVAGRCYNFLEKAQIPYNLKSEIQTVVESMGKEGVITLAAMNLSPALLGAILEILTA